MLVVAGVYCDLAVVEKTSFPHFSHTITDAVTLQLSLSQPPPVILRREASEGSNRRERLQTTKAFTNAPQGDIISPEAFTNCL